MQVFFTGVQRLYRKKLRVSGFLAYYVPTERKGTRLLWVPFLPRSPRAHGAMPSKGEALMYTTILLAAALQQWERYSAHALAAREVAATLAQGTSHHLYVLSVYDDPPLTLGYIPATIASRQQ